MFGKVQLRNVGGYQPPSSPAVPEPTTTQVSKSAEQGADAVSDAEKIAGLEWAIKQKDRQLLEYAEEVNKRGVRIMELSSQTASAASPVAGVSGENILQILKDCCDREWKDETPEQVAVIVSNAMFWRNDEIRRLRDKLAQPSAEGDGWIADAARLLMLAQPYTNAAPCHTNGLPLHAEIEQFLNKVAPPSVQEEKGSSA